MLDTTDEDIRSFLNQILVPLTVAEARPDGGFRFLGINGAHMTLSGFEEDGFVGRGVLDLVPEDEAEMVLRRYATARDTGDPLSYEECLTLPKGQSWWRSTINPIKDTEGVVRRLCVSSIPIDREVRLRGLARRAIEAVEQIENSDAMVTRGVADLEMSLGAIIRTGETLLLPDSNLSPDERHLVELIIQLAGAADQSVTRVREFGQTALRHVLEQALLDQGELATLLAEAEDLARTA